MNVRQSHFRLCPLVVCAHESGELFAVLMEAKGQLWVSSSIIPHLILRPGLSCFCSLFCLSCLAVSPGVPPAASSPSELKECAAMPGSYLGAGDLNLGPHDRTASTLSIEPSS